MLVVALIAIAILGLPLGIAGSKLVHDEAIRQLERQAAIVGVALGDDLAAGRAIDPHELRKFSEHGLQITVRDGSGRIVQSGRRSPRPSLRSTVHLPAGASIVVRGPAATTLNRQHLVWLVVGGLSVVAVVTAVSLARVQARRLTAPLDVLAQTAQRLGSGDFSARVGPSHVREIDAIGRVLDREAARMTELVRREREFTANASHQLRTPLTALRIRLEELLMFADEPAIVRSDAQAALAAADRLDATITEMLALARHGRMTVPADTALAAIVLRITDRWTPLFQAEHRSLVVRPPDPMLLVRTSPPALSQCLDVLIENALVHGGGTVTIACCVTSGGVVIDVSDEGPGIVPGMEPDIFTRSVSTGDGTGVGLHLARMLMEAHGARLDLASPRPATFRVVLPVAGTDAQDLAV